MSPTQLDPIQRWTTDHVAQPRRLDYFAAALSEAVLPVSIQSADAQNFHAEVRLAQFATVGVSKTTGAPHHAVRGRSELARSSEHGFSLLVSLQSSWTARHRGSLEMMPRDVLILDSEYPLEIDVHGSFVAINVGVSEAWLRQWLPNPHLLAARRIPGNSLWGRALSSYLSELSPDLAAAPPVPLSVIADQIGSLLSLTANGLSGQASANTPAVLSLYERLQECLAQRCTEWQLTAADIASSLSISLRSLHRAYAAVDQTFGEELIKARARVAIRMLASPIFSRVTTAEIGRRAGFPSASHFARVIRSSTGRTPLQIRKNARVEDTSSRALARPLQQ